MLGVRSDARPSLSLSALALLLVCAGGCATRTSLYPKFPEEARKIQGIDIRADTLIVRDIAGRVDLVDIAENQSLGRRAVGLLEDQLQRAGYRVASAEVTSVGLCLNPLSAGLFVRGQGVSAATPVKQLPRQNAPFYLADDLAGKPPAALLGEIYRELAGYAKRPGEPDHFLPPAAQLDPKSNHVYFFVLVRGYEVPMGKQLGEAFGTALLSLGTFSAYVPTRGSLLACFVDAKTGEILWCGAAITQGRSRISDSAIQTMVTNLVKQLPPLAPAT